jgi:hypothetical protein
VASSLASPTNLSKSLEGPGLGQTEVRNNSLLDLAWKEHGFSRAAKR